MFCPSCGSQIDDDLKFCPSCGFMLGTAETAAETAETPSEQAVPETRSIPAGEPEITADAPTEPAAAPVGPTAVPVEPVAAAPPAPKPKKSRKGLIIALAAVAVVIAGVLITRAVINNMHQKDYDAARKLLVAEKYEDAKKGFEELGGFKDSKEQAEYCDQCIDYKEAEELMADGKYDEAEKAFNKLKNFKQSESKSVLCSQLSQYEDAEKLFSEKKYAEAKAIYDKLPSDAENFPEASAHKQYCINKASYNAAMEKLKAKKYYEAYKAFNALGNFEDSKQRAQSCTQPFPATGQTYRNPKHAAGGVSLTIVPPSNGQYNYLKIYTGSDLVSCVALGKNQRATVSLAAGSYTIKDAYSNGPWFGGTDMFGDSGTYVKLTNGSSDTFTLNANMIYTLTLRSGTAGGGTSVGSKGENRGSF